jgi:hypothetical protein
VEVGWSREDAMPLIAPFTGKPGLQKQLPENPEPFDFFNLLFEENMWENLVNETNRYAEGRTDGVNMKPFSRMQRWTEVTISEMKMYISLVIAMELKRKPDLESYWSTDPTISTHFLAVKWQKIDLWLFCQTCISWTMTIIRRVGCIR